MSPGSLQPAFPAGGDGGVNGSEQFCSAVLKQEEKGACLGWHKDCVEVSAGLIWMSVCQVVGGIQPKPKHHTPCICLLNLEGSHWYV